MSNEEEYCVVCVDCLSTLDPERVMKSIWYSQGMTPPCPSCGGVTREIPRSHQEQFIKDAGSGKMM